MDRHIDFRAEQVRALIDGRKTMDRRLAWRTRWNDGGHIPDGAGGQMDFIEPHEERIGPSSWQKVKPGDRLWVREGWAIRDCGRLVGLSAAEWQSGFPVDRVQYIATDEAPSTGTDGKPYWWNQRSSIHMPRWASRLTLIVEAVKIERLQEISEEDAKAEGVERPILPHWPRRPFASVLRGLWNELHGPVSWEANPEVVALTFRVVRGNIDASKGDG